MSPSTLRQVEYILDNATEEQKDYLRKGKESINRIHTELKEQEKEEARASSASVSGQQDNEWDSESPEQIDAVKRAKKGRSLEKQIDTHLKRFDGLVKDYPSQDTRHQIITKVSEWVKKNKVNL